MITIPLYLLLKLVFKKRGGGINASHYLYLLFGF